MEMTSWMLACMNGELTDVDIAAFLVLIRAKGETVLELTTAAEIMLEKAHSIDLGLDLIDIVGTGGDGQNLFNISTAASFVAAGAGARIAKHGNRSVSSRSGSADLLLAAGMRLEVSDDCLKCALDETNLTFLFAPHFHQAMQHARPARQALGIRTLFNLLGPIVNPARPSRHVIGVFASAWQRPIAEVLAHLHSQHALVVHSRDGLDEISIAEPTDVIEYHNGKYQSWVIDPTDFDMHYASLDGLQVTHPEASLALIESVLNGTIGARRDIVILNAAAVIYCAEIETTYALAVEKARESIDSGRALQCFNHLKVCLK
jgi:anthranilate phosphoribosyltransferase